ncbi:MAG: hypothetical protein PHU86_00185 [Patescibacteria group bacterium]|jgi:DNA-directed RNA polymerase subunit RPC12/RpoP|nr:hypothetical protein [Patescibacteria group bacterium]
MKKYLCECSSCKAKFEGIIEKEKNVACPACGHNKTIVLEEMEIGESGCNGCSGCSGCH